jgi:superfamily II DNA helicase RecQ
MKIVINTQIAIISIDDTNNDININVLPISTTPITDNKQAIEVIPNNINNEYSIELFNKLVTLRKQISHDEGLPPYYICHDKTIIEMCKALPTDSNSMLSISGMGSKKIDKYGSKFIEAIKEYLDS